jgi:hypothetical protein
VDVGGRRLGGPKYTTGRCGPDAHCERLREPYPYANGTRDRTLGPSLQSRVPFTNSRLIRQASLRSLMDMAMDERTGPMHAWGARVSCAGFSASARGV